MSQLILPLSGHPEHQIRFWTRHLRVITLENSNHDSEGGFQRLSLVGRGLRGCFVSIRVRYTSR